MRPFVHLHVHTEYSLLDGAARIDRLTKLCREMDMPAVAITDHGNMYGVIKFYDTITERKFDPEKKSAKPLKPIIGCEFYMDEDLTVKGGGMRELQHLVLLAKDMEGYKNLLKLNSISYTDGFYYRPRIDAATLEKYCKGLICLSACLAGAIPKRLLDNDYEGAKKYALFLKGLFAEGDFYIELQDHGIREQKLINPLLVKLAAEIGVKTVATNDVHYIEKADSEMQDVLMCVQTGKAIDAENRMRFYGSEFYLKSGDEMAELFSWCPEAIDNTLEIAEKCNLTLPFKQKLLPPYRPKDNSTPEEFLRKLMEKGLIKRYGEVTPEIRERAEYEFAIITKMGFTEYYLIVWDFINYAHEQGIPVGAGRGSGVGSIVAYAVEITNVDPLKYNLLFERFLNPERVSNPDFDIDFCYEGRGQVIEYVVEEYGKDKVAQIITFGTMAAKNAIRDVARVYNMPLPEVDKITKLMPVMSHLGVILGRDKPKDEKKEFKINEIIDIYNNDAASKRVLDMALKLEGMPRNCSTHAAGVVICRDPVSDHVPLQRNGEDITTQYDKDQIEDIGLLKMDFLGLRTLTDVKYAKQYIKESVGVEIDFGKLGYEDPKVYKLIGSGDTDAVFQLESPGMKKFMQQLKPANLEDVIAGISLYRPGPMDSIPDFIAGKQNPSKIRYDHELLKPILDVTYGCIVYQEQVMQIVRSLAGYTYGRADLVRRAMSKKKKSEMLKEKSTFIYGCEASGNNKAVDGCIKRGISAEIAEKIFDGMEAFASYAFNKSHAAAYAVLSYETAFLKNYYPTEFLTAVINNRISSADEVAKYIIYAREHGIELLKPDINKSQVKFSYENGNIRFGLVGIKNVGESVVERILAERKEHGEYKDLYDFIERAESLIINKRMLESMIIAGVFDCFNETRSTLMGSYEEIMTAVAEDRKMRETGQLSFFDMGAAPVKSERKLHYAAEYAKRDKLKMEKEMLGVYVSGHPLEDYRKAYNEINFNTSMIQDAMPDDPEDDSWLSEFDNKNVEMAGSVVSVNRKKDKSNRDMAICVIEDLYGSIEAVFFSGAYVGVREILVPDAPVRVKGRLSTRRGAVSLLADHAAKWELNASSSHDREPIVSNDRTQAKPGRILCVRLDDASQYAALIEIFKAYKGNTPVRIQFNGKLFDPNLSVNAAMALKLELYSLVGEENVKEI